MSYKINKPFRFRSGLELPNLIFPGPMDGVMSRLFCKTVEQMGLVDFWMTPFLRITTGPTGKVKIQKFTERFSAGEKPVIVQLMGTDIVSLVETAKRCKDMGFAGVNFNLACPSNQVLSSGSGGALLKNHLFIKELMEESIELGKHFSISLKIRIGFSSPDEIEEIAKFANPASGGSILDFVVVHHRTVLEGYQQVPNREKRIAEAVKYFGETPVIANGDIDSYGDAEKIVNETGCSGVMAARGWLRNPSLLMEIEAQKNTKREESEESLAKFINAMAVNAQKNPCKGDRNAMIDMSSYIFDRNHPFFDYIIHTPFTDPAKELSKEKIIEFL